MTDDKLLTLVTQASQVEKKLGVFLATLGEDKELLTMAVALALLSQGALILAPMYRTNKADYMGVVQGIVEDIFDKLAEEANERPAE